MSNSLLNIKVIHAIDFATKKHSFQFDDSGIPYVEHSIGVMKILSLVTNDIDILCAAVLHDTIEDTDTTYEEIVKEFGSKVADLIMEVTHDGMEDNHYFPRLHTQQGIMIKFADRLNNISRMEPWAEDKRKKYLDKSHFWRDIPLEMR